MAIVLDILIAVVVLAAVFMNAREGLLQSLAGLAVLVLAVVGAVWAAKTFSPALSGYLAPLVRESLLDKIPLHAGENPGSLLSLFGFSGQALTNLTGLVAQQMQSTGVTAVEAVVTKVVDVMAYAVVFLVAFLVLILLLNLLLKPLELATKLPGLKTLNTLGGGVLGLIKGLVLVFFAVWLLQRLQILSPQLIEESMFLPYFINHSPVSLITGY